MTCTTLDTLLERLDVNRRLTHRFLDYLHLVARAEGRERDTGTDAELARLLAFDPGAGEDGGEVEGSIGWNLSHIAVYEAGCFSRPPEALWRRYRHGAPRRGPGEPFTDVLSLLRDGRAELLERAAAWDDGDLEAAPRVTAQPGRSRRQLLDAAVWHEAHHLNLCNENLRRWFIQMEPARDAPPAA